MSIKKSFFWLALKREVLKHVHPMPMSMFEGRKDKEAW